MFIFWLILPYLVASAVRSVQKKLNDAEDPDKEALRIGQAITDNLRDAIKPALQGVLS